MLSTSFGSMRVCDAHTHFFVPSFYSGLAKMAGIEADAEAIAQKLGWEKPPGEPEEVARRWLGEMDRHGIERVLSIHTLPGDLDSAIAGISAAAGRLVGLAMINPLATNAMEEVQRVAQTPSFAGIALFPSLSGFSIGDHAMRPLLEVANRNRLVVFVHCGVLKIGFRAKLGIATPNDPAFSNPMMLDRVVTDFPNVNFIIPHLGSGYLRELLMLADLHPNIYTDTSGVGGWNRYLDGGPTRAQALRHALGVMGTHRILFGSDSTFFPRGWRKDVFHEQVAAFEEAELSGDQVAQILSHNFDRLLSGRRGS